MINKRLGIKAGVTITFLTILSLFILLGVLFNNVFLEKYYLFTQEDFFQEKSNYIEKLLSDKSGIGKDEIDKLEQSEGITTRILNSKGRVLYGSVPKAKAPADNRNIFQEESTEKLEEKKKREERENQERMRIPKELEDMLNIKNLKNRKELYKSASTVNEKLKIYYIRDLKDGNIIVLSKNMDWIKESVSISTTFFFYTGFIILLLGIPLINLLSKVLLNRLFEIKDVSENVAKLDFSKRVEKIKNDEIGDIGRSINKMAQELEASIGELKLDVDRKKTLVRNISHELKTPIGVIKGFTEFLTNGMEISEEKKKRYFSLIVDECNNMDEMVKGLLRLSKLEHGTKLKYEYVSIDNLVDEILDRLQIKIKEKNIKVRTSFMDKKIYCDEELIKIAIQNYLTNAVNYCSENGLIEIKTEFSDEFKDEFKLSVFNSGSRIEESELGEIWEIFHKSDKARTRAHGGHGIGLSIVKLIVEKHFGKFGVKNKNSGVEFYFTLPKEENYEG